MPNRDFLCMLDKWLRQLCILELGTVCDGQLQLVYMYLIEAVKFDVIIFVITWLWIYNPMFTPAWWILEIFLSTLSVHDHKSAATQKSIGPGVHIVCLKVQESCLQFTCLQKCVKPFDAFVCLGHTAHSPAEDDFSCQTRIANADNTSRWWSG